MAGKKGQKKRFWSDDEKRSICAQAIVPGVSVAQVARRYSMNANLIHTWSKDPRFAPSPEITDPTPSVDFLPVEIEGSVTSSLLDDAQRSDATVLAQRVDITLSDGRRILVEGSTALSGVLALVEGLMRWFRFRRRPRSGWRLASLTCARASTTAQQVNGTFTERGAFSVGGEGAGRRSVFWPPIRLSRASRRSLEDHLVGWARGVPLRETAGTRQVRMAIACPWQNQRHTRPAFDAS